MPAFLSKTHHAIIILWVRQTHWDAIILWSRMTHACYHPTLSSPLWWFIILWVYGSQMKILEGWTNRPERIFEALFKGCECSIWAKKRWKVRRKDVPDGSFGLPKSSFGKHGVRQTHWHAIISLCSRMTHCHAIIRLCLAHYDDSSSCEFDIHLGMLSSSCSRLTLLQWHIGMLSSFVSSTCISAITMRRRLTHARSFNTAHTHAPLTRLTRKGLRKRNRKGWFLLPRSSFVGVHLQRATNPTA